MGARTGRRDDGTQLGIQRHADRDLNLIGAAGRFLEAVHNLVGSGGNRRQRLVQRLLRGLQPVAPPHGTAAVGQNRRDDDGRPVVQHEFNGIRHDSPLKD
jgi:hypothetical protein